MTPRVFGYGGLASHQGIEEVDECELLKEVKRGSAAGQTELIRRYGGKMLSVARRFLRSEHDAEDAMQEAFLSAFRSIDRFEGQSQVGTWLHRIMVNVCLMKLRSARSRPCVSMDELLPRFDDTGHHSRPISTWALPPAEQCEAQELRAQVRECISRLPEAYRVVLLLRDIEEMSTQETAERLKLTETAVKVRLHRARQALRALLEPHLTHEAVCRVR